MDSIPQHPNRPRTLEEAALPSVRFNNMDKYDDELSSVDISDDQGSFSDHHSTNEDKSLKPKRAQPSDFVRTETLGVNILRWIILALLVASGGVFAVGAYFITTEADDNDNGTCQVTDDGAFDSFVQAFHKNLLQSTASRLSAAFGISAAYTSSFLDNSSWPLVTMPHFEARTTGVLQTTGTSRVLFSPLVNGAAREDFETYAVAKQEEGCQLSECNIVQAIYNKNGQQISNNELLSPVWQVSPGNFDGDAELLWNQFSDDLHSIALKELVALEAAIFSHFFAANETSSPKTMLFYPVFEDFTKVSVVGSISMEFEWLKILISSLPSSYQGASFVLSNPCQGGSTHGFEFNNDGQLEYTGKMKSKKIQDDEALLELPRAYAYGEFESGLEDASCMFEFYVLPASLSGEALAAEEDDKNRAPIHTSIVAVVYAIIIAAFLVYDWLVEKRQSFVINIATKSSAIVENLFPSQVRDRMFEQAEKKIKKSGPPESHLNGVQAPNMSGNAITPVSNAPEHVSVKQFLTGPQDNFTDLSSPPIADLFPNTTIIFADIAGFTAWSSQREPEQVFTLLETLYRSFDVLAHKLKVFKVETIGDCYMAVTGLPNPDNAHAVNMSRFAYQCLLGMRELLKELEGALGPGTSDLALRVGLHSGPVTAGVLRGEKSRFQLFGDTVNTASRMESTGERTKIQVSQETADLLMAAGKSHWLKTRDEVVVAKGKGEMKTYWLDPTKKRRNNKSHKDIRVTQDISLQNGDFVDKPMSPGDVPADDKNSRLVDWNVDVLLHHLARVISSRSRTPSKGSLVNHSSEVALLPSAVNDVAEVVALPPFDASSSRFRRARPDVSKLQQTRDDLHEYVKRIALMYRDVPFHNFEHASHVTLCANKLLNRLINSEEYATEEELHISTFGISSDPLTHFAIVFAALIHDVDHSGLPNAQLVKEKDEVALKFDNKSVAEQNSVHIGWEMLMDPRFERLRKCIYQTNVERKRFRQLVINSVMATDIADRKVNEVRKIKWDKAFRNGKTIDAASGLQMQEDMNRKSTAVIEHIIQVSDVAHTMQHWHIYRRWNERLFHEMHNAFESQQVSVDPSTNWYIGELGFFDYYLIPLAMKLKECGVFGASGYEYISYVLKNKKEWERKGRQVVQEMILLYKDKEEGSEDEGMSDSEEYDSDDLEYDSTGANSIDGGD
jgi:class 3 adenylate cyclase